MTPKEQEASRLLNELIDSVGQGDPSLERFRDLPVILDAPATPPKPAPWYRPNGVQAVFGLLVGLISLVLALGQDERVDGSPLEPALIGVVAIAWALGYRRR